MVYMLRYITVDNFVEINQTATEVFQNTDYMHSDFYSVD